MSRDMRQYYPGPQSGAKWYPQDVIVAPPSNGEYRFVDGNMSAGGAGNTWADAYNTIEEATTAGGMGDIIMIAPKATNGYYAENVRVGDGTTNTADEYGKTGMHIMGVTNNMKEVRISSVNAAAKHPYGSLGGATILSNALFITCAGIEVSNLCLDGETNGNGIYWGDGSRPFSYTGQTDAQNGTIHDCTFKMGFNGIDFDGCSNDKLVYNNYFYKQADQGIYIGPGGLQQSSRVSIYNNRFIGPEDYGVYVYAHAQNKNHTIGPNNVFLDQASGTEMTYPVYLGHATPTNGVIGNYFACEVDNNAGTNDQSCGNYEGVTGNTVLMVTED